MIRSLRFFVIGFIAAMGMAIPSNVKAQTTAAAGPKPQESKTKLNSNVQELREPIGMQSGLIKERVPQFDPNAPAVKALANEKPAVTLAGYVEAYVAYNFNKPSNLITAYRAFDNRSETFTLSNAVLSTEWHLHRIRGRITLQGGSTPNDYYASEPVSPSGPGAVSTNANSWKFIQEANMGWEAPWGSGLLIEAGIFLTPVGPEVIAVKDNWNWSRSNLFFALPYYHAGVRAAYNLSDKLRLTGWVTNGWNNAIADSSFKSIMAHLNYQLADNLSSQILYAGGVQEPWGSPQGQPWRNLFDFYIKWLASDWLTLMMHADSGFQPGNLGTNVWVAGALYARAKLNPWFYLAGRVDTFYESSSGTAPPLFYPANRVSSGTLTLDFMPEKFISFRLDGRFDSASGAMFYKGDVSAPADMNAIPNAKSQTTITLGATAWF